MVLIPKGGGGSRGIGLLETIWKLISSIIDRRIKEGITFHDALHGFCPRRGTGTGIIEAKLIQQLAVRRQEPLFAIFLDLKKAYDALDRKRTLTILEEYGVGPNALRLLRKGNLKKAQRRWARVSFVLRREGLSPRQGAMFYKAIVQSVLLYGVETWVLTKSMMNILKGFHYRVARKLSGFHARPLGGGRWRTYKVADVLDAAGMRPMEEYVQNRRYYLNTYVQERPVLLLCRDTTRKTGTPTGLCFWWEQEGAPAGDGTTVEIE